MNYPKLIAAAAMLGAVSMTALPAAAAPMQPNPTLSEAGATAQTVQFRRHGGWQRHGGYGYRGYGHRGYGYGGAALGGLAAGAIIGGAIANSQARANDGYSYCVQRFRSYDPASGTYLGNDGRRHSCP